MNGWLGRALRAGVKVPDEQVRATIAVYRSQCEKECALVKRVTERGVALGIADEIQRKVSEDLVRTGAHMRAVSDADIDACLTREAGVRERIRTFK